MDFPMQEALVQSLLGNEGASYNSAFTRLYEAIANDFVYPNPNQLLVFGDNHDMDRLYMQLNQDPALMQMALTYLLTIRGIPQVFYGTEVLMDNTGQHKVDGLIRSDFPGGWAGDSVSAFTGKGLSKAQRETQDLIRKLLQWRKGNPVIASGKTMHFAPFDGLYVYFRYNAEKTVMVVMNRNQADTRFDTGRFAEILKGRTSARNVLTGEIVDIGAGMSVPGLSASVFEIR
jgi:glycosidase